MAVQVREYLIENPKRTQTAAGNHFGVTRARVSQLMTIHEKLPDDFIEMMGQCNDQNLLKAFSEKRLLNISSIKTEKERRAEIERLLPKT
jgi:hypothetical protein